MLYSLLWLKFFLAHILTFFKFTVSGFPVIKHIEIWKRLAKSKLFSFLSKHFFGIIYIIKEWFFFFNNCRHLMFTANIYNGSILYFNQSVFMGPSNKATIRKIVNTSSESKKLFFFSVDNIHKWCRIIKFADFF